MAKLLLTPDAQAELDRLPKSVRALILSVFERLAKWPAVCGAKPLRHGLAGRYRIRTRDYRVQFQVMKEMVTVEKIGHRDGFYED